MPAGPEPITATFFPLLSDGSSGGTQPLSQARSTMAHSIVLMVTGLSSMFSVQAASQGAGQIRPVNSGKLLVECSVLSAASHWWRCTKLFQSGIRLLTGQPL